mgnify:FL=1
MEMLEAREARARRQRELLDCLSCPVVSFTMNIPGPVKNGPVIRRAFREGLLRLDAALDAPAWASSPGKRSTSPRAAKPCGPSGARASDQGAVRRHRGPGSPWAAVRPGCAGPGAGRVEPGGPGAVSPALPGLRQEGKGCASRRLHSVEELQEKTREI